MSSSVEVTVTGGHEVGQVDHPVGVAPLVIVPGDNLDEARGESNAGISIEDGRARVRGEVLRDNLILSVSEDSLKCTLF